MDDYQGFTEKTRSQVTIVAVNVGVNIWIDWNQNNFIELVTSFRYYFYNAIATLSFMLLMENIISSEYQTLEEI